MDRNISGCAQHEGLPENKEKDTWKGYLHEKILMKVAALNYSSDRRR